MPILSPESADAALSQGLITPEQHAQIIGAPMAPTVAPPGLANAFGSAGLTLDAPPPPPRGPAEITSPEELRAALAGGGVPVSGTTNGALPERPPVAVASSELPIANGPRGQVDVGPIVAARPAPAPAPVARPAGPAAVDPRMAGFNRDVALGERESASAVRQGNEVVAQAQEQYQAQKAAQDAVERQAAIDAGEKAQEQAQLAKQVTETHAAVDDYASQKVDPNRFWNSQGTPQKVIGLLGIALGGFAEGLSGGAIKNPAMAAINRTIDADIHAQEVDIETKGRGVAQKRGMLSDMIAITGSKDAGRSAAKVAALQNLHQQLDVVAAKHGAAIAPEKVEQIRMGIDQHLSDEKTKLDTMLMTERRAGAAHAANAIAARDEQQWKRGLELQKLEQEQQKIDKAGATGPQAKAGEEDAGYRADKSAVDIAWKNATETNPGSRISNAFGKAADTDEHSVNAASVAQIVGKVKGVGDSSESDTARLLAMTPQPGDDESTLNKKYGMLMAQLATKHPGASERAVRGRVQTTAPPERK